MACLLSLQPPSWDPRGLPRSHFPIPHLVRTLAQTSAASALPQYSSLEPISTNTAPRPTAHQCERVEAGQGRREDMREEQGRAEQSRADQSKAEQSKAGQSKTEQSKAE